ncbi:MAG: hypothetical protein K2L90_05185 [Muribaculaceae bacterium]|nr:hypothetical protein [Muribaculaceae bacterium]
MKIVSMLIILVMAGEMSVDAATRSVQVDKGTAILIRLVDEINSGIEGVVHGYMESDVYSADGEYIAIQYGAPVTVNVMRQKRRSLGRPGKVQMYSATTTAVDGSEVVLALNIEEKGNGKQGLALGLGIVTGIPTLIGFLFFLIEGCDATIPSGAYIPGEVAAYYSVAIPEK